MLNVCKYGFVSLNAQLKPCSSSPFLQVRKMSFEAKDFKVPVPWGHIAGQEWGTSEGEPWIGLHGWLDNSGTFQTLAPFFAKNKKRLLAIDLPGHGFSSHYGPGMSYHYLDGIQYIRRVAEHLGLAKFNLIGHSMGGGMAMLYTAVYPDHVSRLIMLDAIKPISRPLGLVVKRTRQAVDDLFNIERKLNSGNGQSYAKENAIARLLEATNQLHGNNAVTRASAEILLKRGMVPVDPNDPNSEFVFTRDLRQRAGSLYGYTTDALKEYASHVKCPHLIVKADGGSLYEDKNVAMEVLDVYKRSNEGNFVYAEVHGSHHVHLNDAETVWGVIETFLKEHSS